MDLMEAPAHVNHCKQENTTDMSATVTLQRCCLSSSKFAIPGCAAVKCAARGRRTVFRQEGLFAEGRVSLFVSLSKTVYGTTY